MKKLIIFPVISLFIFSFCSRKAETESGINTQQEDSLTVETEEPVKITLDDIEIEKDFLYDQHTLEDTYPYKDTTRIFQWDKIRAGLFLLDSIQLKPSTWAILQNYKNLNGESPLIRNWTRNAYKRVSDTLGVERYQSVAMYLPNDTTIGERYGRDGSLVKHLGDTGNYVKVENVNFDGEWLVPKKYVKFINDTVIFRKAIFVDRTNQNITTLEKVDSKWLVRSMNPATTGLHKPPYQQETPTGIFVIQEKKRKMVFLKDGSKETGGYAPYASRFTNGGYIHGVPVNAPSKKEVEYSWSLGTTPRSHMCVRNATSHAKFVYDWAPSEQSIVFVIE